MAIRVAASADKAKEIRASPQWQRRRMAVVAFLAALSFLANPLIAHAKSEKDQSADAREKALQLFQKALAVSDIRASGSQPFEMVGVIEVSEGPHKSAKGSYSLLWAAPDRWREEIHFADYTRVRVGKKGGYWQLRSIDYEPLTISDLDGAFGYFQKLRHWAQPGSIAGVQEIDFKDAEIAGAKSECALLTEGHTFQFDGKTSKYKTTTTYCFNASNGGLASTAEWVSSGSPGAAHEYSDFVAFAGKIVPSTILVRHSDAPRVAFHMSQIVAVNKVDPTMFVPPPGAQEWDTCAEVQDTLRLVKQLLPRYPMEARVDGISGEVYVYAVVGTDGRLHKMKVLASPALSLSSSTLQALKGWRYQPAACDGKPVAVETFLKVVYSIGR